MPARGIHHVDLTVSDVERSVDFYSRLLGPFGFDEYGRYPSYRGTEEVVYGIRGEVACAPSVDRFETAP
jgi:catechol 2,3-dioxygenase-like lactoylglutathione lyase family enzyme